MGEPVWNKMPLKGFQQHLGKQFVSFLGLVKAQQGQQS